MRAITKGREPRSLTAYRREPSANYDDYREKNLLRRALVAEQRGLCCYCMNRIRDEASTTIEHWKSRSRYPKQQLVYRNLLAACPGGAGQSRSRQHCDTRKGNRDLSWNPADANHHIETRIRYEVDGSIRSDEEAFNAELDDVLNLNLPILMNHRKGVLDSLTRWWRKERPRRRRSDRRLRLQRERERWLGENGELRPFCQVAVWALDQRIAKLGQ